MQQELTLEGNDVMTHYLKANLVSSTPLIYRRLALMTLIGGVVGRRVYVEDGDRRVYPNMYTMLVGDSGSKKSTAIDDAVAFLGMVGYKNFPNVRSSTDKFLDDFAGRIFDASDDIEAILQHDPSETRLTLALDEAKDFFCAGGGSDIETALIRLYDCPDEYKTATRSAGNNVINKPYLSFIGGATPQTLADIIKPYSYQTGLLARTLLVCETIRPEYVPQPVANKTELGLASRMLGNNLTRTGPMQIDPAALELLNDMGQSVVGPRDSRLRSYVARRRDHLLKLAMITAICCNTRIISTGILVYANSILTYCECTMHFALGGYGLNKNGAQATEVLWSILHTDGVLYQDDLSQRLGLTVEKLPDLTELLGHLVHCGLITLVTDSNPYYTVHKRAPYFEQYPDGVDAELLQEWQASNKRLNSKLKGTTNASKISKIPASASNQSASAGSTNTSPVTGGSNSAVDGATPQLSLAERVKLRQQRALERGDYAGEPQ